jgi:Tfp pilus assembly protein FimT
MRLRIGKILKGREGFSFNELLVVIFLMGLILMIAVPNVTRWIATSELKSATRTASALLKIARVKAVAQNKGYQAVVDTAIDPSDGVTKYRIRLTTKDSGGNTVVTEQMFFKKTITVTVDPTAANPITYMPSGLVKFPTTNPPTTDVKVNVVRKAGQYNEQGQVLQIYVAGTVKESKVDRL